MGLVHLISFMANSAAQTQSSGTDTGWYLAAAIVAAGCALASLLWNWYKNGETAHKEQIEEHDAEISHESKMSGEYLKRSLDAFDELVNSLQTEVSRMTAERNEARKLAELTERKLSGEIESLRREVKALRLVLIQNGIPLPPPEEHITHEKTQEISEKLSLPKDK